MISTITIENDEASGSNPIQSPPHIADYKSYTVSPKGLPRSDKETSLNDNDHQGCLTQCNESSPNIVNSRDVLKISEQRCEPNQQESLRRSISQPSTGRCGSHPPVIQPDPPAPTSPPTNRHDDSSAPPTKRKKDTFATPQSVLGTTSEEMLASSLNVLAMACEMKTDTETDTTRHASTSNRGRAFEPARKSHVQPKKKPSDAAPLPPPQQPCEIPTDATWPETVTPRPETDTPHPETDAVRPEPAAHHTAAHKPRKAAKAFRKPPAQPPKTKTPGATPLPSSQDATKPYSNISNEWVVPSRPTGGDASPANNSVSVTSPISINDVLCGRGGLTNHHPGNIFFRKLVRHHQESYLLATKRDKAGVARGIVDTIRSLKPHGRFLKKARGVSANGVWEEIGDRKAREKTSQALRERAPELWEKLQGQVRQQQPRHLNIICSDEKTNEPDNTVLRPILSKANMVLPLKVTYDNVLSSPDVNHVNANKSSPSHDIRTNNFTMENAVVRPVLSNALVGPNNMVLQREVTCDNVFSSQGINSANVNIYSPSHNIQKIHSAPGNATVGQNMVLTREVTLDNVYSSLSDAGVRQSPAVNPVNFSAPFSPYDVRKTYPAPDNVEVRPVPSNVEVRPVPSNVEVRPIPSNVEVRPVPSYVEVGPVPSYVEVGPVPSNTSVEPNDVRIRQVSDGSNDERSAPGAANSVDANAPSAPQHVRTTSPAPGNAAVRSSPSHDAQSIENPPKRHRGDNFTVAHTLCDRSGTALSMITSIPCSVQANAGI